MRRDSGSIFIDTMIAAAIVAVSLGAMCQVIANSAARHRMTESRRTALMIAQSELAAVGSAIPISVGQVSGAEGRYVWLIDIEPRDAGFTQSKAGSLWTVSVVVRAQGEGELARLESLRLGPGA